MLLLGSGGIWSERMFTFQTIHRSNVHFFAQINLKKRSNTHFNEYARDLSTRYTIFTAWFMLSAISRYVTLVIMVTQVLLRYMN